MLYGYSDASMKDNKVVATSLILSDSHFIDCFTKEYDNISTSTEAELRGVIQTVQYIKKHCNKEHQVVIITDNKAVALKYINILSNWVVPKNSANYESYKQLLELSEGFKVNVQNIRGHQESHNPNKVCDIMSKVYMEMT